MLHSKALSQKEEQGERKEKGINEVGKYCSTPLPRTTCKPEKLELAYKARNRTGSWVI